MSGTLTPSPAIYSPIVSVALKSIDNQARGVACPLVFGPSNTQIVVAADNLPPNAQLGSIGSIYVDNTSATAASLTVTFDDTGASFRVAAGSAEYFVAVTGTQRMRINTAPTALTQVYVQILNRVVGPSGLSSTGSFGGQPSGGTILYKNTVPIGWSGWNTLLLANPLRRYLALQMPAAYPGFVTFTATFGVGGVPVIPSSFGMQAGEKYQSGGYCPQGNVLVQLTGAPDNTTISFDYG